MMHNDSPRTGRGDGARDDLFTPSLAQHAPRAVDAPKPWRVHSQLWIAFFGGVLPFTLIAYLNSRRLGLPHAVLQRILLVGVAGFVATVMIDYVLVSQIALPVTSSGTAIRVAGRIAACVCYLVVSAWQRPAERAYQLQQHAGYSSLWGPGIAATLVLGFAQNVLVFFIVRMLQGW